MVEKILNNAVFREGAKQNLMANKACDVATQVVIPLITGIVGIFTAAKGANKLFCNK